MSMLAYLMRTMGADKPTPSTPTLPIQLWMRDRIQLADRSRAMSPLA